MSLFNVPASVLLHHLKTSFYALSAAVLVSWVTNALNEDLIFKPVMRYFFPEDVARYLHPFDNSQAFFIWFVPLCFSLVLMFGASMITIHRIKKPHVYRLNRAKELRTVNHAIIAPTLEQLEQALTSYTGAQRISLLVAEEQTDHYRQALALDTAEQQDRITVYPLKSNDDLVATRVALAKLIAQLNHQQGSIRQTALGVDLTFSSSLLGSAAMFCALEQDIELLHCADGKLKSYDVSCVMAK